VVWISTRENFLGILLSPSTFLLLIGIFSSFLCWHLPFTRKSQLVLSLLIPLLISSIYSPAATSLFTYFLENQVPETTPFETNISPVIVLVGRGPIVAAATTEAAAQLFNQHKAQAVYISGDVPQTRELLMQQGVPSGFITLDSSATTTWENASFTSAWLSNHYPGAPVILITDPWQLARAARAFSFQGLSVIGLSAMPEMSERSRNHFALRETLAYILYWFQARI
jgi:uncharacterized SAM-binding protein YcdF (DUF218 family)